MEIVKITKERMQQVLPKTVKDSCLSNQAKKLLATIINYHLVNNKAKEAGFLAINNEELRTSATVGKEYFRAAIQELVECKLIYRRVGKKWSSAEKNTASEYYLIKENLTKPVHKPTTDELLEQLFTSPVPQNSEIVPTNTITISDTYSETISYSNSETYSDSETISKSYSDSMSHLDIEDGTDNKKRPRNQKELQEYFKNRMEIECKDKSIEELNEIQEVLKTELDEFNDITGYQNVFKYFIIPAIRRKKERLSSQYLVDIMTTA